MPDKTCFDCKLQPTPEPRGFPFFFTNTTNQRITRTRTVLRAKRVGAIALLGTTKMMYIF